MALNGGFHHLPMNTDAAQADYNFFTKTMRLHAIKRTVLFDGVLQVEP